MNYKIIYRFDIQIPVLKVVGLSPAGVASENPNERGVFAFHIENLHAKKCRLNMFLCIFSVQN